MNCNFQEFRLNLSVMSRFCIFSCAPGYVGNPQERQKCRPYDGKATLGVRNMSAWFMPENKKNGRLVIRCSSDL